MKSSLLIFEKGGIFIALEFKSFYKQSTGNELSKCKYPTRLDTYGCGCSHNCSYCYARSLLDFRNLWNPLNPRVADINKIARQIDKIEPGTVIRLGGMTDCFQAFENAYRVTYKTIQLLNERRIHYLIVTKSDMVASDKYLEILDKELAHIQISITSTDDKTAFQYEKAPSTSRRIAAIEKLYKLGYDVSLRLSPFIFEFIDFDVLNNINCDKVLVEFLRVNTFIKRWFKEIDFSKYTLKQSNYLHLPLETKIEQLQSIIGFKELTVCEDVTEHYEYWKNNVNPNKEDCCNLTFLEKADSLEKVA